MNATDRIEIATITNVIEFCVEQLDKISEREAEKFSNLGNLEYSPLGDQISEKEDGLREIIDQLQELIENLNVLSE
jgi:hypothetical protein